VSATRIERDLLGEREVPAEALHGIHTERALESFRLTGRRVHAELIRAYGAVKLACARANHELGHWDDAKAAAIEAACAEMMDGRLDGSILVDALQGGAGTSTNMNVNEVLANRALQILGRRPGDYDVVHPIHDLNLHQSTNDTYPTALRVAAIRLLRRLERELVGLVEALQEREKAFARIVKVGRTEMQDAVPVTLGRELGAWAEAFGRDRWRISKCEERLRVVNLGGTAVGTGLGAPRRYIFRVVEHLRDVTGLGLARAENMVEATQNADALAEVSGIMRTAAVSLLKVSGDLRLLSSGPEGGFGELRLPPRQAGSSAMPGKVNPVIPEAVSQAALAVLASDQTIAYACGLGSLELNAFLPLIADELLRSLELLGASCSALSRLCIVGLEADAARCRRLASSGTAAAAVLVEVLGYDRAQAIALEARRRGSGVREVVVEDGVMTAEAFDALLAPESVNRLGSPEGGARR
jgi:aspartate ammonia-lyase